MHCIYRLSKSKKKKNFSVKSAGWNPDSGRAVWHFYIYVRISTRRDARESGRPFPATLLYRLSAGRRKHRKRFLACPRNGNRSGVRLFRFRNHRVRTYIFVYIYIRKSTAPSFCGSHKTNSRTYTHNRVQRPSGYFTAGLFWMRFVWTIKVTVEESFPMACVPQKTHV